MLRLAKRGGRKRRQFAELLLEPLSAAKRGVDENHGRVNLDPLPVFQPIGVDRSAVQFDDERRVPFPAREYEFSVFGDHSHM
jgi:hypothetical protein